MMNTFSTPGLSLRYSNSHLDVLSRVTPHAQRERSKANGVGVHIYLMVGERA